MTGKSVCYHHGGKSLSGPAHPSTIHGRHWKYLPARLRDRYEESQRDGELLALHQEINVVDALLAEALQRLDATDSSQLWAEAVKAYRAMETARRAGDPQAMRVALIELGDILERGNADRLNRGELIKIIDARKKLVESERKRHVEMQNMVTSAQAMTLVSALGEAVREHVRDPDALAAISAAIVRLVGRPDG